VTSPRFIFLFMAATCAVLMGVGLYLEHVVGLEPCPLCVMQRIFFILVGVVALIAGIQAPGKRGRRIYGVVLLLLAAAGAATAGRQVYLQTVPAEELAACLPSLDYMMQALPFQEIIRLVLHGTADCAEVNWTLFGLSIPEWSLLAFVLLMALSLVKVFRRR